MKTTILVVAIILLAIGLIVGWISNRNLSEVGKTKKWSERAKPFWMRNAAYTPKGQTLVRVSSVCMVLGALACLAALFAKA
jgi:hypothetical protein